MGIYDRDYERSYDTGSGWRDGGGANLGGLGGWSANAKLLVAIVAVYVAQNLFEPGFDELFALPSDWYREPWRVYSLVTYSMLHSLSSVNHLLFNGLAIFFFGRSIEAKYGSREYIAFFFTSAAFGGLVWSLTELASNGGANSVLVGASGGIAAVLVLFALNYPNVQVYIMGILPIPAWLMAVLFLAQDMFGALQRSGNVAYTAHLGGALFGYLYFRYQWRVSGWLPGGSGFKMPSFKPRPKLKIHKDEAESTDPSDDRVDQLLDKIQRQGQDSLTASERRYLEQASKRYKKRRR